MHLPLTSLLRIDTSQVFYPEQNDPYYVPGSPLTTGLSFGSLIAISAKGSNEFAYTYGNDNFYDNNTIVLSREACESRDGFG